jgi:glutaminyl-peptide cyclotransferase
MNKILIPICLFSLIFTACGGNNSNVSNNSNGDKLIPKINYTSIKSFPHDTVSFTEGFLFHDGELYESTGATEELPQTKSLFGVVDFSNGKISPKVILDRDKYFGEGITFLNGKVFQLTYRTKVGFIYDAKTFKKLKDFKLPVEEGWGMTTDGKSLIMSDGTSELTVLDPNTLQVTKKITVSENGALQEKVNELEYINGFIYANIWTTNTIIKIKPESGEIVGKMDLTSLSDEAKSIYPGSLEMNGIAYDSISNKVYITGKLWPKIYQIQFNH